MRARLLTADTPAGRLRRWTEELLSGRPPRSPLRRVADRRAPLHPGVSLRAHGSRHRQARRGGLRSAGANRSRAPSAHGDCPRRVPGHRWFRRRAVEQALRAAVQTQRDVGYVFAGSEPSLMERMLGPRRPFYKAGPVMRLEKIDPWSSPRFIDTRFAVERHPSRARPRRGDRRPGCERAVRRAAPRARDLGRCTRARTPDGGARRPPRHADAAAGRAPHGVRGILAAAHARRSGPC